MSEGLSDTTANTLLGTLVSGAVWVQKHVGPPGADGTANVASDARRVNAAGTFGTPAGGQVANTATIGPWTAVPTAEVYTHFSAWTASSGGTFRFSGRIESVPAAAGLDWPVPVGACVLTFPVAS